MLRNTLAGCYKKCQQFITNKNRLFIGLKNTVEKNAASVDHSVCLQNTNPQNDVQNRPNYAKLRHFQYAAASGLLSAQAQDFVAAGEGAEASGFIETPVVASSAASEASSATSEIQTETLQAIEALPEAPLPLPTVEAEILQNLPVSGEATFASIGLGGWSPIGMIENCLEYLHVTAGVPWWGTIAIGTLVVRIVIFPLVIAAQRNGAKMNNYMPQLQVLQLKMTEARQMGNQLEAARYSQELMLFMRDKGLNPVKNLLVPLAQMPVFISFFMSLREMANVPVESMRTGGLFWFTDLTVCDQFFILPIITSVTMWATIEVGTDSARLSAQNMQTMKYVLRALPVVILPFTINFPGAILCYWVSTNFISLLQVGFLRIPAVRDFFKIEQLVSHDHGALPVKKKGFVEGLQDSWTNIKISKEVEDRRKFDELQFQRAGRGPIVKTYKLNPLEQGKNMRQK